MASISVFRLIKFEFVLNRDPNMPPALVCLKELLSARLAQINKNTATIEQLFIYQSSLSMNIVRFVNFITEPYQTNIYAKPIKAIANQVNHFN